MSRTYLSLLLSVNPALQSPPAPVELGRVAWQRDHEAAFQAAREAHKPVLLLFQEVPG
jgi:hypothetical protein